MNNNNEWKKVCAACAEGMPPARCAYYGDPDGCNAPTLGKHPEGDLAERLQEELEKAERRIAELERSSGNAAAMRRTLEEVEGAIFEDDPGRFLLADAEEILHRVQAALAAPPRNCDVKYADGVEMYGAFKDWCKAKGHTMDPMLAYDAFEWLLAKANGEVPEKVGQK